MTALGVGFVPLQSDWQWAEQNYGVKGTPETALVDQQGRIMFKPHVHDAETRARARTAKSRRCWRAGRSPD